MCDKMNTLTPICKKKMLTKLINTTKCSSRRFRSKRVQQERDRLLVNQSLRGMTLETSIANPRIILSLILTIEALIKWKRK